MDEPVKMPSNFKNFESVSQWWDSQSISPLYSSVTNFPSEADTIPNLTSYIYEVSKARDEKERSAIIGQSVHHLLKKVVLGRQSMYLMQQSVHDRAMHFMRTNVQVSELVNKYSSYIPVSAQCNDVEILNIYKMAVKGFRSVMKLGEEDLSMAELNGEVINELSVKRSDLTTVKELLNRMINRRGNVAVRPSIDHSPKYISWLEDPEFATPEIPLNKRNKNSGAGYEMEGESFVKKENIGQLLLTTAIQKATSSGNPAFKTKLESILALPLDDAVKNLIRTALHESQNFAELVGQAAASSYEQQIAATDIIFNLYFWLKKADIKYEGMLELSRFLNSLSKLSVGREKISERIRTSTNKNVKLLYGIMSHCTDIHLPPFMLTINRLPDLYATIGCINSNNVRIERGSSWRNICLFSPSEPKSLEAVLSIFKEEKFYQNNEIYKSEHMFHQLLLKKRSPLQWAGMLNGNALEVKIKVRD